VLHGQWCGRHSQFSLRHPQCFTVSTSIKREVVNSPAPDEIRKARENAGLSQTKAGEMVHVTCRTWQQWEARPEIKSHQKMHPAFWELFNIKLKKLKKSKEIKHG